MAISYTKVQRQYAKENGLNLCTVAAPGVEFQSPCSALKSAMIESYALHVMGLVEDKPFERVSRIELPPDLADVVEDLKLMIARRRATKFDDLRRSDWVKVFNALSHYVLMSTKD